jgi:hypothetical protein
MAGRRTSGTIGPVHPTSGQAAVETALTLPLTLFIVLGTLQLFMMLQARLMTEHAVFEATRAGALSSGNCTRMKHAALLTLLPTFTRTDSPARVANAFRARNTNAFAPSLDSGHNGEILWLYRENPAPPGRADDETFDDPDRPQPFTLETRMVFWFPMRIPFANWVIARAQLAAWGLADYNAVDPLMPAATAHWTADASAGQLGPYASLIKSTMQARTNSPTGTYVFPIQATAAMRMMTPPRAAFLQPKLCK